MRRPEDTSVVDNQSRSIAFAGVAIAISLLCLILFRGVLSIIQAIIIPVVIVLLSVKQPFIYSLATGISLLALTLIFFPVQFVFVLTYLLMAFLLQKLYLDPKNRPIRRWGLRILYFFLVGLVLYSGIVMTDAVFGTHLNAMMHQLSRANTVIYVMIIMLEALVVSAVHIVSLYIVRRRVNRIHRIER